MSVAAMPPDMRKDIPADSSNFPAWHKHELAERLRRLDAGNEPTSPWAEAKKRIRSQIIVG
jgi:hypothetical protein